MQLPRHKVASFNPLDPDWALKSRQLKSSYEPRELGTIHGICKFSSTFSCMQIGLKISLWTTKKLA